MTFDRTVLRADQVYTHFLYINCVFIVHLFITYCIMISTYLFCVYVRELRNLVIPNREEESALQLGEYYNCNF